MRKPISAFFGLVAAMLAVMFAAAGPAAAQTADGAADNIVRTEHATTRLLSEGAGLVPGETTTLILDQTLQDGWHVYWKNPGDSGLPLALKWTLPQGYAAGEVTYPVPHRVPIGPLVNYGFFGRPAFLIPLAVPKTAKPGSSVSLRLKAGWLICADICVPEEGAFTLQLPVVARAAPDPDGATIAAAARRAAPAAYDAPGALSFDGKTLTLSIAKPAGAKGGAYFFPEAPGLFEPSAPQTASFDSDRLQIKVAAADDAASVLRAGPVKGVLGFDEGGGVDAVFAPDAAALAHSDDAPAATATKASTPKVGAPKISAPPANLGLLLIASFVGGLILNLMPCVFPVVFIKAAALMKSSETPRMIRLGGFAYTLGVLTAFLALGGALLALRAGGEQLGWGFHLQSPAVVLGSAFLLFLVALNLSGVFEIGTSLQGAGGALTGRSGAVGAYFTGLLAVVVAAPCVGPFLTAPIGAAVVLPPAEGLLIFLAMGAGLASPFLALGLAPGLGRFLPRPGAWMATLRQALAFPVYGGAAYFLWVLTAEAGGAGLARGLAGAVLLGAGVWALERGRRGFVLRGLGVLALSGALWQVGLVRSTPVATATSTAAFSHGVLTAEPYSAATLEKLRAEGRPVFVDFTAAWCATCQFNRLTVFSDRALGKAFADAQVGVLVGDWTRRDPEITAALAAFGANGVPLYVYYPPQGGPQLVAQPLSAAALAALVSASGQ